MVEFAGQTDLNLVAKHRSFTAQEAIELSFGRRAGAASGKLVAKDVVHRPRFLGFTDRATQARRFANVRTRTDEFGMGVANVVSRDLSQTHLARQDIPDNPVLNRCPRRQGLFG